MRSTPPLARSHEARAGVADCVESLRSRIGRTPLLAIRCRMRGIERTVYVKAEGENLTGSIKDRSAIDLLLRASVNGQLRPGDTIALATGNHSGVSFAAIGRALGYRVRVYMPAWRRSESWRVIEGHGAEIVAVSREEGGLAGCLERARRASDEEGQTFLAGRRDAHAAAHRDATGPELIQQLGLLGLAPTHLVAGVGTGATLTGVGDALRRRNPAVRVHPLEAANSPSLRSGAASGSHRIEGLADECTCERLDLARLDRVVEVWDGDAILAAQRLSRELGLAVGVSSGANLLGALEIAIESGSRAVVVTVFPDSGAGNAKVLASTEPVRPGYLTPELELLDCDSLRCA